jgi:hypothetical protein
MIAGGGLEWRTWRRDPFVSREEELPKRVPVVNLHLALPPDEYENDVISDSIFGITHACRNSFLAQEIRWEVEVGRQVVLARE